MHEAKSLSDVYSFDKSYVTGLASGVNSSGFLLRFAPRGFETWIRLTEAFNQLCRGKKKKLRQQQNICSCQRTRNSIIPYFSADYFQMTLPCALMYKEHAVLRFSGTAPLSLYYGGKC